ncbi:selenium metabolism-associated LysR family transcriptional regulator [Alkalihalobacillus deserti]|uniref:selenium metabolism-associated LysR family transcriptional regulator n=1 Tax=Alkalihalobacillus deserti TaxID=2879466 RepID=UPI001D142A01|nr:selenium metabolism-associated LysR family transcriptional regulator [Alkalihalobacillus deserti]
MNYEQLKTFLVVSEKKSFSETAKSLFMSQPTITSQIKSLEKNLNTTLFERSTKHVKLTPSAKVLYRYGKEIINLTESAEKEILNLCGQIHGQLEISCSLTIGENLLPHLLGRFKNAYPLIEISIDISNTTHILQRIKNHSLDLGMIEAPVEDPDLILEPFMEDELVIIAKPDFFYKEKLNITQEELTKLPLILREKGSGTRTVMTQHLIKNGLNPDKLNIFLEMGSTEAVKSAVEAGLGVSIISRNAIKKELRLNSLKTYNLKGISLSRHFYIVCRRDTVLKPIVETFLKSSKSILAENTFE